MLSLLVDSPLDVQQRDFATAAHQSAEALLTVLNDILDFSKIEAGKLELDPAPFDLRLLLEEVADMLAPGAETKGLDLMVHYSVATPHRFVGHDAGSGRGKILVGEDGHGTVISLGGALLQPGRELQNVFLRLQIAGREIILRLWHHRRAAELLHGRSQEIGMLLVLVLLLYRRIASIGRISSV